MPTRTQKNLASSPTVLITGAARRIGAEIATYLHQQGFCVAIHCHESVAEATALVRLLNERREHSAAAFVCDLMQKKSASNLITKTVDWAKRLDVLVNNASIFSKHEVDWDDMFIMNVKVPYWLSEAARPHLATQFGSVINITDIHAEKPLQDYALYCQTKAALAMQTKSLALSFAPTVRVNAVAPGAILWPEGENALNAKQQNAILAKTCLQRHGDPLYIAKAVYSLIDNPFITGQTLVVDGGRR